MNGFDPDRADAVRERLIAHVAEPRPPRRILVAVALLLAGALTGAGVSAGAFAATRPPAIAAPTGQPIPALPAAVEAPPGVLPGAPIISLLGEAESLTFAAPVTIDLTERPEAATHARVTIAAASPGTVSFGTDPAGNNPSASWSADDDLTGAGATTWYDFPLDATTTTLFVTPTGATGIVTLQYVTHVPTRLGVNARGETYGVGGSIAGEPDLVAVVATTPDGALTDGYARASDLSAFSPEHPDQPATPDEALVWQAERDARYPDGWDIPVYASDGITPVGTHRIG